MSARKELPLDRGRHTLCAEADGTRSVPATNGREFWRGLEELADTEAFREYMHREFPEQASVWSDPITRRRFLTLMGASLALAGLSGCSAQPPAGRIMPYVRQPEQLIPGKPLFFATAMILGGLASGLVVQSREGRPIKVEGNQLHPASLGATDAFAQAAILGLYDPDRSQGVTYLGRPRAWNEALSAIRAALGKQRQSGGKALRVLTETITSPSLADQLMGERNGTLRTVFPEARWYQYEPARSAAGLEGARLAFGEYLNAVYRFESSDVVLALDADFLSCGPAHLRYVHDFTSRRRMRGKPDQATMSRLYVVESMPSTTGAVADHRLPLRAREVESFARALAAELGVKGVVANASLAPDQRRWVSALVRDLEGHRGSGIVLAGDRQPPSVHALAHAMNQHLGNIGKTVLFTDPLEARPGDQGAELAELVRDMGAGRVEVLLIVGGNPVFTAPTDLEFERHMQQVPLRVHLGLYQDETAVQCHWHVHEAHFLESWGDARAFDGTVSVIQPLIAPLYGGRSASELLSALIGPAELPGLEIVRTYWREHWPKGSGSGNFERDWAKALHEGFIAGSAFAPRQSLSLRDEWLNQPEAAPPDPEEMEIVFGPDPTLYDGRFANNGWLQELPKPLTKLTWDNAAFVSPGTAQKLGLTETFGDRGGEHGQAIVEVVELHYAGRTVRAPAWVLPGHADNSVTVHFGYGRTRAGSVGTGTGFDAYRLRTSAAPWFGSGLDIRKTGELYTLACTQMHHAMEGRDPVRAGTLVEYQQNPQLVAARRGARHEEHQRGDASREADPRLRPLTLYPPHDYQPPNKRWGMVIDLSACVGCGACVVACQAENNIPIVGKAEVTHGREMHWLRIDRYYRGPLENPEVFFQPVPCMHCEDAPCELVCPVGATVHSSDGLNDMVYNRCVGTRYCSNNCPYKVRRFNFLQYADFATETLKLGRNPEVTVRSRGVMEKCTYCVQRIRTAEIDAEIQDRPVRDGDVLTACQASCPAQAIVFGDLAEPGSQVGKLRALPLNYELLGELNTRPRTSYLAALRNPNPELE
jgi:molybdopterin-containing oxidoreductase family iron-sulfur binding subunit